MSLISRSSRRTSCWMTSSSRSREAPRLHARQGLDGAAQRGQRVLQFMRDIGGEALDRVDAVVERLRHVAQRAREMADLVGARGEIGDLLARLDAAPHPLGRLGELAHRLGDRAGERTATARTSPPPSTRKKRRIAQRSDAMICVDVAALRRQQQRAAHASARAGSARATETIVSPLALTRTTDLVWPCERVVDLGMRLAVADPGLVDARLLAATKRRLTALQMRSQTRRVFVLVVDRQSRRRTIAARRRASANRAAEPSRS